MRQPPLFEPEIVVGSWLGFNTSSGTPAYMDVVRVERLNEYNLSLGSTFGAGPSVIYCLLIDGTMVEVTNLSQMLT